MCDKEKEKNPQQNEQMFKKSKYKEHFKNSKNTKYSNCNLERLKKEYSMCEDTLREDNLINDYVDGGIKTSYKVNNNLVNNDLSKKKHSNNIQIKNKTIDDFIDDSDSLQKKFKSLERINKNESTRNFKKLKEIDQSKYSDREQDDKNVLSKEKLDEKISYLNRVNKVDNKNIRLINKKRNNSNKNEKYEDNQEVEDKLIEEVIEISKYDK